MDTLPARGPSAAAPTLDAAFELQVRAEDDVPLGWECADPALQIESWGVEHAAQPSSKS